MLNSNECLYEKQKIHNLVMSNGVTKFTSETKSVKKYPNFKIQENDWDALFKQIDVYQQYNKYTNEVISSVAPIVKIILNKKYIMHRSRIISLLFCIMCMSIYIDENLNTKHNIEVVKNNLKNSIYNCLQYVIATAENKSINYDNSFFQIAGMINELNIGDQNSMFQKIYYFH